MGSGCSRKISVESTIVSRSREPDFPTLFHVLQWRATNQPDQVAYVFLQDDGVTESSRLTYSHLDKKARAIAHSIQAQRATGERVLLLYPPGPDLVAAFFACLYAGAIAVLTFPPDPSRIARDLPRLQGILKDAGPVMGLTNSLILMLMRTKVRATEMGHLPWLNTTRVKKKTASQWIRFEPTATTLAFFQYSSGSTGDPKGVMLSHANLLHNSAQIGVGFGTSSASRGVIWLPPYHDMGLIGGIIHPLHAGFPVWLISPLAFLRRPVSWLQAIHRYRATVSGGPNFAYDLCARKTSAEDRKKLDFSCWEVAFTGAEPVFLDTLDAFCSTFSTCGFRRSSFYPCYGLAEATLIVSGGSKLDLPLTIRVSKELLKSNQVLEMPEDSDPHLVQELIGCGGPLLPDCFIEIVNPKTRLRGAHNAVGEVWVANPSVSQGYWRQPSATAKQMHAFIKDTCEGPFLRTGDLGFLHRGQLFITGRSKDLIIIRGRNFYPQDIEKCVVDADQRIRPGCQAAFGVTEKEEERLIVVSELRDGVLTNHGTLEEIAGKIRQEVSECHAIQLHTIVFVKPRTIPKTTSGKIRRKGTCEAFLTQKLDIVGRSDARAAPELPRRDSTSTIVDDGDAVSAPCPAPNPSMLSAMSIAERREAVEGYVYFQICTVLRCRRPPADRPLGSLGMDSMMAVELKASLEHAFACTIPQTLFDVGMGPSPRAIIDAVLASLPPSGSLSPSALAPSVPP